MTRDRVELTGTGTQGLFSGHLCCFYGKFHLFSLLARAAFDYKTQFMAQRSDLGIDLPSKTSAPVRLMSFGIPRERLPLRLPVEG